ncbi:MAG: hypothetical protein PHV74_14715 [Dehalococcoidia bacterium]|nr:hypothetical protein [Dehalococcoidia bacterium]
MRDPVRLPFRTTLGGRDDVVLDDPWLTLPNPYGTNVPSSQYSKGIEIEPGGQL